MEWPRVHYYGILYQGRVMPFTAYDATRVCYVKGWLEETEPGYRQPKTYRLVTARGRGIPLGPLYTQTYLKRMLLDAEAVAEVPYPGWTGLPPGPRNLWVRAGL